VPAKNMATDMKINTLRNQSTYFSTLKVFTSYTEQVYTLANNLIYADQVDISESQKLALSYIFIKVGENNSVNKVITKSPISKSHGVGVNDIYLSQGLKQSAIPYSINQPADL